MMTYKNISNYRQRRRDCFTFTVPHPYSDQNFGGVPLGVDLWC